MVQNPNDVLRHAGRYVRKFRNNIFVIKLGGNTLQDPTLTQALCAQIALLWSFSIKIVLVHGGGPQLDRLNEQLGLEVRRIKGRRVTDESQLDAAICAFHNVQVRLNAQLRQEGLPVVGLNGIDAGLITAAKRPIKGDVDFGWVGDIQKVDPAILKQLLDTNYMPLVSPITGDDQGKIFNTNADTIAAALAVALGATKLFFVMLAPGLLTEVDNPASLIPSANLSELESMKKAGQIHGGMQPKCDAIEQALRGGVQAAHLIGCSLPDSLLTEVFTNEGCGTMITLETVSETSI